MRWLAVTALLLLAACGQNAPEEKKPEADSGPGVKLSAEEIKSLGIATVPAQVASYRRQIAGYGVVTALDAIAQTDADVATATAAATQSAAAAARARSLATGEEAAVSREVVEAAESKAAADQAALALARRKTEASFGQDAPWRDAASRQAIMARLAAGQTVLVRVTFPLGSLGSEAPQTLQITRLGSGGKAWTTRTIWNAPADPALPGRGFYALVDGSDLVQNEHVTATVPVGGAQAGLVVPADALVYGEAEAWVYLQIKPDTFLRAKIGTGQPMGDGYFVPNNAGIAPGQRVVTSGAGLLLAHEVNPSTAAED